MRPRPHQSRLATLNQEPIIKSTLEMDYISRTAPEPGQLKEVAR